MHSIISKSTIKFLFFIVVIGRSCWRLACLESSRSCLNDGRTCSDARNNSSGPCIRGLQCIYSACSDGAVISYAAPTGALHNGHASLRRSQGTMQSRWKRCWHGSVATASPLRQSQRHIAHVPSTGAGCSPIAWRASSVHLTTCASA